MARVGLPAKYAKMGFKKGWREYKASKNKTRRTSSNPKKTNPIRVTRRKTNNPGNPHPRKVTVRRATMKAAQVAQGVAVGAAGASGSAMLANAFPIQTTRGKALMQAGIGLAALLFTTKKMPWVKIAGSGAALAGGFSLVKSFVPQLPLFAGMDLITVTPEAAAGLGINKRFMGANPHKLVRKPGYTNYKKNGNASAASLGEIMEKPNKYGYGGQFLTPANL